MFNCYNLLSEPGDETSLLIDCDTESRGYGNLTGSVVVVIGLKLGELSLGKLESLAKAVTSLGQWMDDFLWRRDDSLCQESYESY